MSSLYARFIVRHSYLILFTVSVVCTVLTVIPLVCHDLPTFSDPIIGFETRGTILAHRFVAWENLIDETRPSRSLAVNPKDIEDQMRMNRTFHNNTTQNKQRSGRTRTKNKGRNKKKTIQFNSTVDITSLSTLINTSNIHVHWGYGKNVSFEDENSVFLKDHIRKQWVSLREMRRQPHELFHENYASGGCGAPMSNYAHLVITTEDNNSMLSFRNVMRVCKLQSQLIDLGGFTYYNLCQRPSNSEEVCCPIWSLPNYVAILAGKNSCKNVTVQDVRNARDILEKCAQYFHNFKLMATCELNQCEVPKFCSQYDAVYNLLFYIIDTEAFSPSNYSQTFVKNTMIFLPLACSSTVMPYYNKLQSSNISYQPLAIAAIDFGLKNALFDQWIIEDTWLVGLGGIFVLLCVWVYTKSLLLTIMLFIAITYSLGTAYFLYVYVYCLDFFPFMNLLVIVVVIGIGADDAFLYMKVWRTVVGQIVGGGSCEESGLSDVKNIASAGETILIQIVEETLKHSVLTMLVTSLTTAVAFVASFVSHIPAINCFSVFACTAVLVNFVLMITWLPATLFIMDVKMNLNKLPLLNFLYRPFNDLREDARTIFNRFITSCISKLHIVFVLVLGILGLCSIITVFYYPGLQLPDSRQFQLFQTTHLFEQYDLNFREKFIFEKFSKDLGVGSNMPLRWVWGVRAVDNGNHMNPTSYGRLILDKNFLLADTAAQKWLLGFCARLKAQPFYQSTLGPLLPNCFIESFKMFMSRRCVDSTDNIDRRPCCEESRFPYKRSVFEECVPRATRSLYETPRELFIPGVAGPKFLRAPPPARLVALVVEFESAVPYSMSYKDMDHFYATVENWTQSELRNAPLTMQSGWFVSDLQFYDLQKTLASGTVIALVLSAGLGFAVLLPATRSLAVSTCALLAMMFSCTVTIAVLVVSGWRLNVLESVTISTSAGLAVDFSLHYALSYTSATGGGAARARSALSASAGPTAAAALSTGAAGIFLLRSNLLPYSQIGTFLALITSISWVYGTFFLCSALHLLDREGRDRSPVAERKSLSRVSSVCSALPQLESHELEQLADSGPAHLSPTPSTRSASTVLINDDSSQAKRFSLSDNDPPLFK